MSDPRHILIVEDMPSMSDYVMRLLRKEFPNSLIECVPTLAEAKRIIEAEPSPDFSFIDLTLSDAGQDKTIKALDGFHRRTIVVVVTGAGQEVREALQAKGFEVILKSPFDFTLETFLRAILRAITKRNREDLSEELSGTRRLKERLEAKYAPSCT